MIEEFGLPGDGHQFNPQSITLSKENYYRAIFSIWEESRIKMTMLLAVIFGDLAELED